MPAPFPALTLPGGGPLPLGYRWLHAHGVVTLTPWHWIEQQPTALRLREEFLREVSPPNPSRLRDWMPFARRQDVDEVAGFVIVDGAVTEEVAVVHLTWCGGREQPGWPTVSRYPDVWAWLVDEVIPSTREWANDEEADLASD